MKFYQMLMSVIFCGFLAVGAFAGDGWGRNDPYAKLFNPATMQTVTGKIVSIDRESQPLEGMAPGFSVMIRDEAGKEFDAQVGPAWFTSFYKEKWDAKVGDKVTITGSAVKVGGKQVIIVQQGSKGKLKMTTRNKTGVPVWDLDVSDF